MNREPPQLAVVNTEYLFQRMVRLYGANLVCDVGSFDGAHALRFARPDTRVVALEASPMNAQSLASNSAIAAAEIDVFHVAAWSDDGDVTFNVIDPKSGIAHGWYEKISSIRSRLDPSFDSHQVTVKAVRLDSFVADMNHSTPSSIALWIDVEGAGYDVLEGISGIRDAVSVIHIEVETTQFWEGQSLWVDILALMKEFGFSAVARSRGGQQFNAIFVNTAFRQKAPIGTIWVFMLAWARHRIGLLRSSIRKNLWPR